MALKLSNGTYLKLVKRSSIQGIEGSITKNPDIIEYGENGEVISTTPQPDTIVLPTIRFMIGGQLFKDQASRIASETDQWVKSEFLSFETHSVPDLPEGWKPKNPETLEAEKLLCKAYLAVKTLPGYEDSEDV